MLDLLDVCKRVGPKFPLDAMFLDPHDPEWDARGVILQKAAAAGAEVKSYTATRIKKSLTGNGRATKAQMQRAAQTILALVQPPEPDDVADAIAVSLCCANETNLDAL